MDPIMAKGPFSDLVDKVFNSFLKSLEKIFDGKSKDDEKEEKGKITLTTVTIPNEPILDANGKQLGEDAAKFEVLIEIQWPEKSPLTRKEAREIVKSGNYDDGKISLTLQFKNANKAQYEGIKKNQLNDKVNAYVQEYDIQKSATKRLKCIIFKFNEITEQERQQQQEDASSSNRLQISLKKVTGTTGTSVNLIRINANYDIEEAMNDVSSIVSDDAFVEQLPENEEACYEVTSDENDYDVNECDANFSCQDSIHQIIWDTFDISLKIKLAQMTFLKQIRAACSMYDATYAIDCIMDILSDALQDTSCAYIPGLEFISDEYCFTDECGKDCLIESISSYLDKLQVVYDCVSIGIQYKLSEQISRIEDFLRKLRQN